VDIDHMTGITLRKFGTKNLHISGKDHQMNNPAASSGVSEIAGSDRLRS
jgi:hypothetical protein